ncbi:MAG: helix-turn-helix domain-containing protein [Pseudomonadota bacterium]
MGNDVTDPQSLPVMLNIRAAAAMLNVSPRYLTSLLESGQLPFERAGRRRRMARADVLALKRTRDAHRRRVLDELARADGELL